MAVVLVGLLRELFQRGGFNLRKCIYNSRPVLEMIPQSDHAKEVKDLHLGNGALPVERSIGVYWDLE